jgi:2-deoxy-D-gluconate 3-dehydrogenase
MKKENVLDKFDMHGRTVLITGGAGLLGKQFSLSLAQAGANVMVSDLDGHAAREQAEYLKSEGFNADSVQLDVTDPDSVRSATKAANSRFGSLDVLVNCAAINPKFDRENIEYQNNNAFENYPLEAFRQTLDVNLTGMFLSTQAAAPYMLEKGKGVIVNICSIYGLVGPDQSLYHQEDGTIRYKPVDYSVAKAGVLGFTRYLAAYYAGKNIRVNALTPGGVFNDHDPQFSEAYGSRTLLGRMAHLDEMNAAMLFLCSDASSYMTGSNLIVDGGWTA